MLSGFHPLHALTKLSATLTPWNDVSDILLGILTVTVVRVFSLPADLKLEHQQEEAYGLKKVEDAKVCHARIGMHWFPFF